MARKRMIDPSFWTDEKIGSVEPRARLLFMGLISQADDSGRLSGHPALIKSLIFPYDLDITLLDVEKWIALIAEINLILRYEVNSQKYILITNFNKHQTINRPQPSKLPEPTIETVLNDHGTISEPSLNDHAQKNLIEFNLREDKLTEGEEKKDLPKPPIPINPFKLFESEGFGTISIMLRDTLGEMIDFYSEQWVIEAMKIAVKRGKRSLSYVEGILKGFKADGIDEPWNKKEGANSGGNDQPRGINQTVKAFGNTSTRNGTQPGESRVYKGQWDDVDVDVPLPAVQG